MFPHAGNILWVTVALRGSALPWQRAEGCSAGGDIQCPPPIVAPRAHGTRAALSPGDGVQSQQGVTPHKKKEMAQHRAVGTHPAPCPSQAGNAPPAPLTSPAPTQSHLPAADPDGCPQRCQRCSSISSVSSALCPARPHRPFPQHRSLLPAHPSLCATPTLWSLPPPGGHRTEQFVPAVHPRLPCPIGTLPSQWAAARWAASPPAYPGLCTRIH